jgi:hypothetical protein
VKLHDSGRTKFEALIKGKTVDGKVVLTAQEIADAYVEQARDAYAAWQKQVEDLNKSNEAKCRERFTPAQLSQAESAVGFFSSFDPAFSEFAKAQLNNPIFTNAMRLVGERLSEDTFEPSGQQPMPRSNKTPAERMGYVKPKPN